MRIWIFNHHALTPDQSGGTRHFDFARHLVNNGHSVTIFASSFHYAKHEDFKAYAPGESFLHERHSGVDFVWIKTRPYRGNGVDRVVNMLDYMRKAQRIAVKKIDASPDIVIGSSVHLFAVLAAYRVAGHFHVPFVMEVRDLWPQTLIDMGIPKWHPFIVLLGWLEKFLYRRADAVITNLPRASEYIERYVPRQKIHWIPNGVDLSRNTTVKPYRYPSAKLHVVYAGAIGKANSVDTLMKAAEILRDAPVCFHLIGDGPARRSLEAFAKDAALSNVHFYGSVNKQEAISMINGADLLFFPLVDSPVFRFGISSNKLFDYLASGKPILFASNAANNPVKEANAGFSVPAENPEAVAKAITEVAGMPDSMKQALGDNGLQYVRRHYAVEDLTQRLEKLLVTIRYNAINSAQEV